MKVTICFTYFKSLSLANLEAALYSVRQQDMTRVKEVIILDNDTTDAVQDIQSVIDWMEFHVPAQLISIKHGSPSRTHSWSTNNVMRMASTPWVLFTRADYLLDADALSRFVGVVASRPDDWDGFVTANVYHLGADISTCERQGWREFGLHILKSLSGVEDTHTCIDAGVWMMRRKAFEAVGGLDESLTAWGHAQTHLQWKLHKAGTECVRIPEVLFYHPQHAAPRDIELAHRQLEDRGVDLKEMWARYEGLQPYK